MGAAMAQARAEGEFPAENKGLALVLTIGDKTALTGGRLVFRRPVDPDAGVAQG